MVQWLKYSMMPMLCAATIALAQAQPSPGPNPQDQQTGTRDFRDTPRATNRDFSGVNMSRVVNARVINARGEEIGTIKDIAFDARRGRAAYALVSSREGGVGDQLYVVPWNSINARGDGSVALNTPDGRLLPATRFNEGDWSMLGDRTFGTELHRAYGQRPYWDEDSGAMRGGGASTIEGARRERDTGRNEGEMGRDRDRDISPRREGTTGPERDRDMSPGRDRTDRGTGGTRDLERGVTGGELDSSSITLLRGSELRGQRITNRQHEAIGSINDLVIDAHTGRVAYPLVSVGDYLGTRDDQVPVPWQQIQFGERGAMTSDLSRDLLRDAPRMDRTNPPRTSDSQFVNRVYQYYGNEPFIRSDQNTRTDGQRQGTDAEREGSDQRQGTDAQRRDDRSDPQRRDQATPPDRGDTNPDNQQRDRDRGGDDRP